MVIFGLVLYIQVGVVLEENKNLGFGLLMQLNLPSRSGGMSGWCRSAPLGEQPPGASSSVCAGMDVFTPLVP